MADNEIIEAVAAERRGWTVPDVAAHLNTLWSVSMPSMMWRMIKAGGSSRR